MTLTPEQRNAAMELAKKIQSGVHKEFRDAETPEYVPDCDVAVAWLESLAALAVEQAATIERLEVELAGLRATMNRVPKRLADDSVPYAAQTVFGVSPWGDIETLYVEDNLLLASTIFPHEAEGLINAAACAFPVWLCYPTREGAEAASESEAQ